MSLTIGSGPFGPRPAGGWNFEPPEHVVYVEAFPRRVRARLDGETVIDSQRTLLVHESGKLPHYAFPTSDVQVPGRPEPHAEDHLTVAWDAVDAWFEEDERVEVHPRDAPTAALRQRVGHDDDRGKRTMLLRVSRT